MVKTYLFRPFAWVFLALLFNASAMYSQVVITTDTVIQLGTCPGDGLLIPFQISGGSLPFGTEYFAEWSDPLGNFSNPDTIGSISFIFGSNGIIPTQIPQGSTLGIYRVRVVTGAIIGSQSPLPIIISLVPQIADVSANGPSDACQGETVELQAGFGFGGTAYAWSNGDTTAQITIAQSGNYNVTVTDFAGCEVVSDSFPVNIYPVPEPPSIYFANGLLTTDSVAPYYHWLLDGDPVQTSSSPGHLPTQAGYYNLFLEGLGGCLSTTSNGLYFAPQGSGPIPDPTILDSIGGLTVFEPELPPYDPPFDPPVPAPFQQLVYPNPSFSVWNLYADSTFSPENTFWLLYDAQGHLVMESPRTVVEGVYNSQIDASELAVGDYYLRWFYRGRLWDYHLMKARE